MQCCAGARTARFGATVASQCWPLRSQANCTGKVCVEHVGSNLRYQEHCEPLPRGATHSSLTSYTAPPSTSASARASHGKLRVHATRAVDGVRLRIQTTLRSPCKRVCKLCCQGCGSTCDPRADTQRGAPAGHVIGVRAAQRVCKLRRVGHAARAHRSRFHMQSKPCAHSSRRASDRAREHMTATSL